jgi:hypothetical protein
LRSASILARNSGITRVEMLNLEKDCVIIREDLDEDGNCGDLIIKRGLKAGPQTRPQNQQGIAIGSRKPDLAIQMPLRIQPANAIPTGNLSPGYSNPKWGISGKSLPRDKINLDPDTGLHTLRDTFLTEAGEHTDAFTLHYIAGHDTIKTTMRYVHLRAESVSRAFARINQKKKPAESA